MNNYCEPNHSYKAIPNILDEESRGGVFMVENKFIKIKTCKKRVNTKYLKIRNR